ncbi:MAG: AAA family ATPase [Chloroflexi bacterium]|nr:AAA family ATPase [Chloroflexota bacterium]
MEISKIQIKNFRNFKNLEIETGSNLILLGENGVGKTNFLEALHLVLDPSANRVLRKEDFFRGVNPFGGTEIEIQIQFAKFQNDPKLSTIFSGCEIALDPRVAQVSFLYRPKPDIATDKAVGRDDYEFIIYGGNDKKDIRQKIHPHINLRLIPALRDIDNDMAVWRHSPLRRLIELMNLADDADFQDVVKGVIEATNKLQSIPRIKDLQENIKSRLADMIESGDRINPSFGLLPLNANELQKALKLFADSNLSLDRSSLGFTNVLYLKLLMLEVEKAEQLNGSNQGEEYKFIILAVEEPESHLHPHLQRLVFRDFLKRHPPVLLSTHSPHIVSVSNPDNLVLLKDNKPDGTIATSTAGLSRLPDWEPDWDSASRDLARFLDAIRGEVAFSRGVILVEGDAEIFLIPEFVKQMKDKGIISKSLDGCGITVCNVAGTHFGLYVRFLGPMGLGLPIVILTDGDKYVGLDDIFKAFQDDDRIDSTIKNEAKSYHDSFDWDNLRLCLERNGYGFYEGLKRGIALARLLDPLVCPKLESDYSNNAWDAVRKGLADIGIFVNEWTLEASLISIGYQNELLTVYQELGASARQVTNMKEQLNEGKPSGIQQLIKNRIEDKGKGRFAQRLADKIDATKIPEYIALGIQRIVSKAT